MLNPKREYLSGWGRTPLVHCASYRPEKERELAALLQSHSTPMIVRGQGRAYGDAALQPHGVIRTERLDHLMEWEHDTGIVRAQAGVTLAELLAFAVPRGFLPPVLPGTQYVSLGGAFACNVHGKNQYRIGEFAEHVTRIRLLLASGKHIECSAEEHPELFWATAGGMGMTGIIEEMSLRLRPIPSLSLCRTSEFVDDISSMLDAFERHRDRAEYMVGWIDHMAVRDQIGRGIFAATVHVDSEDGGRPCAGYQAVQPRYSVPCIVPGMLLNRYSMALYNQRYFRKHRAQVARGEMVGLQEFFHPLDRIGHWNRLYGKRGFFQYQCLFPEGPELRTHLQQFLRILQREGIFSFLAVIKYHRPGRALLSFSKAGYSLALDLPNSARVRHAMPLLNHWVAERGGRVYLAKDALLTADMFERMYGAMGAHWRDVIREWDPHARFSSRMSERLGWKEAC